MPEPIIDDKSATAAITFLLGLGMAAVIAGVVAHLEHLHPPAQHQDQRNEDRQHDDHRPEDVDTDQEDHAGDDWRYACNSRPVSRVKKQRKQSGPTPWSLEWVIQQDEERKKAAMRG